jgi:hypothetical protein
VLALKSLADARLSAASVLATLHHRRIIPLMERELRIFEMDETAKPVALARSRSIHDRLPPEYAATRARRAVSLRAVKNSNDDLWSFVMLPDAPPVSGLFPFSFILPPHAAATLTFRSSQQRVAVNAARSDPPTPRARARARRSGGSTGNKGARNSGCVSSRDLLPRRRRSTRRRERRRRKKATGGRPPERWEPAPPSPRAVETAEEQVPGAGVEVPAAGRATEEAARAAEVPARAAEASGSAMVATLAAASAPTEPSKKRKRRFSTLR